MEHKRDIGELLEEKLKVGAHSPKDSLWDRLDASLEKAARKRRRVFWLWSSGIAVVAISLSVMLLRPNNKVSEPVRLRTQSVASTPEEIDDKIATQKETSAVASEIVSAESTVKRNEEHSSSNKNFVPPAERSHLEEGTSEQNQNHISERNSSKKDNSFPDTLVTNGFTKKTTHQYFNSETGKTVYGTKQEIDSLVRLNKIKMAKKDSISRARASDSIKLNQRTRDSVN